MSEHEAMKYPLIRAHALVAFSRLNNGMVEMEIDGEGYIFQEASQTRKSK